MPGRSVWKGVIAFGAATMPVSMYLATSARDAPLRMLHQHQDGSVSRVEQRFVCPVDDAEVSRADAVRGIEQADGQFVVLTEEELAALKLPSNGTLQITSFAPAREVDAVYLEQAFSLSVEDSGRRAYALLQHLLVERELVAVGQITKGAKEQLCILRPMGGELLLWTLYYADEVRVDPQAPPVLVGLQEGELAMGGALVELMERPFDLSAYQDGYRASLQALIQAKAEGGTVERAAAAAPANAPVPIDLMTALRSSVEAAEARQAKPAKARGRTRASGATPRTKRAAPGRARRGVPA